MRSRLFHGHTAHQRLEPAKHGFRYRMFWLGLDLEELEQVGRAVRGFAYNRRSLAAIHDADYSGPGAGTIREKIMARLEDAGFAEPIERITLITIPRVVGYVFNPVSFYLCYGPGDALVAFTAEVRNTFGEMHHYTARPLADDTDPSRYRFTFPKEFYVSPFLDTDGRYELQLITAADRFDISIDLRQDERITFSASMRGEARPLTSGSLLLTLLRLPLFAATIMVRIHWQALKLRVLKRIGTRLKPTPSHPKTFRVWRPSWWYPLRERLVRLAFREPSVGPVSHPPQKRAEPR